jgi:hypothetical protein
MKHGFGLGGQRMAGVAVFINGRRVCEADGGIGGGVTVALHADDYNTSAGDDPDPTAASGRLSLAVFGSLTRPGGADEYVHWADEALQVGDEVLVRLTPGGVSDEPVTRNTYDKATAVAEYRGQLAECAAGLTPDERRELLRELIAELQGVELG